MDNRAMNRTDCSNRLFSLQHISILMRVFVFCILINSFPFELQLKQREVNSGIYYDPKRTWIDLAHQFITECVSFAKLHLSFYLVGLTE